jgi:alpha-1,2-mannosyltransferase
MILARSKGFATSSITEDALGCAFVADWLQSRNRWERAALIAWTVILLFVSVRVLLFPTSKTVYPIFSTTAHLWWCGAELYEPYRALSEPGGYRYSPAFAVLVSPFAALPDGLGGVLWRWVNVAAMLAALWWFARSVLPCGRSADAFAGLALLVIPLNLASVDNGQSNLLVCAGMLGAVAAVREERFNLAGILIGLTFVIKVYPVVLGCVLVLLYPRLGWRIALAVGMSLLLPFCFQQPAYALDQHAKWLACMLNEDRTQTLPAHMYRDLWLAIYQYGLPIHRTAYVGLQVLAGLAVAQICWRRQHSGWPPRDLLTSTLGLIAAWIMLLGPATEASTYTLLAPSLAWSILEALQSTHWRRRQLLLWTSTAILMLSVLAGALPSTVRIHEYGIHAFASLLYFCYLITEPRRVSAAAPAMADAPRAVAA